MGQIGTLLKEEMPREKLIRFGPDVLTDVELLAIILKTGTAKKNVIELSREILSKFYTKIISRTSYNELLQFSGIGSSKACEIVSLFELARRIRINNLDEVQKVVRFKNSKTIYDFVKDKFLHLNVEKVMIIYLNSKNEPKNYEFLFSGGFNKSYFDLKIVLKKVIENSCSKVVLVHNHPSGDSLPSVADIDLTKKLKSALSSIDVKLIDHLVVGRYYCSFFDRNLM